MKYIRKVPEPFFFTNWKKDDKMAQRGKPNWNRLKSEEKKLLRSVLIEEQGGICCYCGIRVLLENSHIEHFRNKDQFPELQLEYTNLLCSCQSELQKSEPKHCGNAKGSWFEEDLVVSPLDPDCESRFQYLENGSVNPSEHLDKVARETIIHLALDIEKLRELRKSAISAALDELDNFEEKTIRESIEIYSQHNPVDKNFLPFCSSIVNVLLSLLP